MKKKSILLLLAIATLILTACNADNKVIDFPIVGTANNTSLVIERVERTDTATLLTIRGFHFPGNWIRIPAETKLMAQGKEYTLKGSIGVEIGKELYMPEDGDSCFTLMFEPLPEECHTFDYMEGAAKDDWTIYDIDLTGRKGTEYPTPLPQGLKKVPNTDGLQAPQYAYTFGETTINVHLLGYRDGCCKKMVLPIYSPLDGQRTVDVTMDPSTGKGTATFTQYGTGYTNIVIDSNGYGHFLLAPGETVELYVNLAAINKTLRYKYPDDITIPNIKECWTQGSIYDAINNLPNPEMPSFLPDELFPDKEIRYDMTADEYVELLIEKRNALNNYFDSQAWHPWIKEIQNAHRLNLTHLDYITRDYRKRAERKPHIPEDYTHDPILPKHYERWFADIDLENPWILLVPNSDELINMAAFIRHENRSEELHQWIIALAAVKKAYDNTLTDEELQTMRSWKNPFFADVCEDIQKRTRAAIQHSAKNMEHVEEVASEALFQTMIAPHKGKVVLVDFWNTWCIPCRNAIQTIEPYKTGELASNDLVWIYIANETSPIETYAEMIPNIKGLHYRVNDAQWNFLTYNKFDIESIPSYVLVDKDGNYSLRKDLRDHTKMVNTLKEMIKK